MRIFDRRDTGLKAKIYGDGFRDGILETLGALDGTNGPSTATYPGPVPTELVLWIAAVRSRIYADDDGLRGT